MGLKLAVIGGGSTYTPEFVDGLIRMQELLAIDELVLHDPDTDRLAIVGGLAKRMLAAAGHRAHVVCTNELAAAVEDAAAVLLQLRVGGQAARAVDERLPLSCGCLGQETTGFGGLAKALRTVPVVLEIAEEVRARSPQAWIVDFTNPVGIVTRALLDAGHRAVGLCSSAMVFQRHFAKVLGVDASRVELDHLGLNHLTVEVGVRLDGREVLDELVGPLVDKVAPAAGLSPATVRRLGVVPSYYLHYFYDHDALVEHARTHPSRAEEVTEIETELLRLYADEALSTKPELLSRRGGAYYSEAAVELLASLFGTNSHNRHVVNVRNQGVLDFLADDAVVEVPALVTDATIRPLPAPALDPLYRGLIAHVSAYEEIALEAARKGGTERVFRALLAHPLIGQLAPADELSRALVAANRAYLPWA